MARLQNIEWSAYEAAHTHPTERNHSDACRGSDPEQILRGWGLTVPPTNDQTKGEMEMGKVFTITDMARNQDWTVRVVFEGDRFGRDMCLVHDDAEPLIEFYDADHDFDIDTDGKVLGQFVTNYGADSLLEYANTTNGITLHGGVPKWKIEKVCYLEILSKVGSIIDDKKEEDAIEADQRHSDNLYDIVDAVRLKLHAQGTDDAKAVLNMISDMAQANGIHFERIDT